MGRIYDGLPIAEGIAFAQIRLVRWGVPPVPHRMIPDDEVDVEVARLDEALISAQARLHDLQASTRARLGSMEARIFDPQLLMLEDADLVEGARRYIRENRLTAARAV